MIGVLLLINGDIKDIKIPLIKGKKNVLSNLKITNELFTSDGGTNELKKRGQYIINPKEVLYIFGYSEGTTINKHEIIPFKNENDEIVNLFYGNILIIKCNEKNKCLTFTSNDYETMYTNLFYNNESSDNDDNLSLSDLELNEDDAEIEDDNEITDEEDNIDDNYESDIDIVENSDNENDPDYEYQKKKKKLY